MMRLDWGRVLRSGSALWVAVVVATWTPVQASASDVRVRGILDLVFDDKGEGAEVNYLWGDNALDSYRLRLFVESAVSDRLDVFTEALYNENVGVVPFGAYVLFHPSPGRDMHVMAGLIPWPIGTWAPRANSNKNPLIGFPLQYQYHTTLSPFQLVPSRDALIADAGDGEEGASYAFGSQGMPIVYDQWWDFGAVFLGSARPVEYSVGFVNGAPSWPSPGRDSTPGKSFLGRVGLAPTPGIRFGVSGSYGPYLIEDAVKSSLPPGKDAADFNQVLGMADFEWSAGHAELRAEGYANRWQTPTVGDLLVRGGYGELKYTLPAGFYVA
ncbi:MAG TPA: hypothetical protein VER77_07045, partial [Candidatus Dormibacteraeota bacterium]|nr:hypothetical protein [Candidatus Dormibacteraeota bacterium]